MAIFCAGFNASSRSRRTRLRTVRIVLGILLALLAFGFLINLAKEQAEWGGGGWTKAGREHAATMIFAMLLSTLPFAFLLALSLWGSLALLKSAAVYRTIRIVELVFATLMLLIAFLLGLVSIDRARSVETLFEGAFFVLLEAAAAILLFVLAFRSELLQRLAGKILKVVLAVLLLLMTLVSGLALLDTFSMSRFERMRTEVVAVMVAYILLELSGALTLLITTFRGRAEDSAASLKIA
jgi:hypothetical protein